MTKLDEIEEIVNTPGEPWPDMHEELRLLIRAMRQLGAERTAYQKLFEAVDNVWNSPTLDSDILDAYNNVTATAVPDRDVLELLEEA